MLAEGFPTVVPAVVLGYHAKKGGYQGDSPRIVQKIVFKMKNLKNFSVFRFSIYSIIYLSLRM
ncbi:hypothetical protein D7D25_12045 [Proteiniphilum sp. X52]|nr:hypothetical protein D7D25_12045 [Proteiniphilum sp. X52]